MSGSQECLARDMSRLNAILGIRDHPRVKANAMFNDVVHLANVKAFEIVFDGAVSFLRDEIARYDSAVPVQGLAHDELFAAATRLGFLREVAVWVVLMTFRDWCAREDVPPDALRARSDSLAAECALLFEAWMVSGAAAETIAS